MSPVWPFPRADALPPYAFVVTDAAKEKVLARGADLIDLGLGNPDRPTPAEIVARLHEQADVGKNHRYHPGPGIRPLREAAARWYERRYGIRFDPDRELVITMGAKEGMSHLCLAILQEGDVSVVPDPCYPIHAGGPLIAGSEVEFYRSAAGVSPSASIQAAIERITSRGKRPKLVIANYPQNPTGEIISREEMARLVSVVERSGALLLHDLAYADLDFQNRYAPSIFDCGLDSERVKSFAVEVFSTSKSYNMAGWRIGLMAGNARMVGALSHLKTYLDYGTFAPIQHAAAWALDHGDRFAEGFRELYRGRAKALVDGLKSAGWPGLDEPRGTMFVWAPIPEPWRPLGSIGAATRLIEEAHVAVSPGVGFGPGGNAFVRFALIEDPPRLLEACERIGRLLARDGAR